jgi:glycerate kinase
MAGGWQPLGIGGVASNDGPVGVLVDQAMHPSYAADLRVLTSLNDITRLRLTAKQARAIGLTLVTLADLEELGRP